jgi:site-specific recombinase XerD
MDLFDFYKQLLSSQKLQPSKVTIKNYLSDLRAFVTWFEKTQTTAFNPDVVTPELVNKYLTGSGFSPRSQKRYLSSLKKFFSLLNDNGLTLNNPFTVLAEEKKKEEIIADPWQITNFRNYLYETGSSHHTIKNYITDIQAFTDWCTKSYPSDTISAAPFSVINPMGLEEYKQRLTNVIHLSPRSINRKLSSIRKYVTFLQSKNLITHVKSLPDNVGPEVIGQKIGLEELRKYQEEPKTYSSLPPVRLTQKLLSPYGALQDKLASVIASKIRQNDFESFKKAQNLLSQEIALHPEVVPVNIPKDFYAPTQSMISSLPFKKKLIHHAKYTRPAWYKKYHALPMAHYLHLGILLVYASIVGFAVYRTVMTPSTSVQAQTATPKSLYFQGKLTDKNGNPLTNAVPVTFSIYNSMAGTGPIMWREVETVTPQKDGTISVALGSKNPIPASIFDQYNSLFLGVKVGDAPELAPRQRLSSTSFAADSRMLSGMGVITDSNQTSNVILALDSTGNLTIGDNANPTFQATGGEFTLQGETLILGTNLGSNGNISLHPDGIGLIDMQKALVNTTANGAMPGSVEVDDQFAVNATQSAQAAAIVNNNGFGGDLFTASSSGITKFVIDTFGHVGIGTKNPIYDLDVTGNLRVTGTTLFNNVPYSWPLSYGGKGAVLTNDGTGKLSWADPSTLSGFNQTNGVVTLKGTTGLQITDASGSAKFSLQNLDKDVASLSTRADITLQGGSRSIGTENLNSLTLGSASTGTVFLSPQGRSVLTAQANGTIGINTTTPTATVDIVGHSQTDSVLHLAADTQASSLAIDNAGTGNLITAGTSSTAKFQVKNNGDVVIGQNGTGKLTVGTIDPLYTISGQKYSTYAPSMPGVKEEVAGRAELAYDPKVQEYAYTLNFNQLEKGSDLWLFGSVIDPNINYVSVLLTPDSQAMVWYKKDIQTRTLTFLSDSPVSVSYRLTAPRFDHEKWSNSSNETADGLVVPAPPTQSDPQEVSDTALTDIAFKIASRDGNFSLVDTFGNSLQKVAGFSNLIAAKIQAGIVSASRIDTGSLFVGGQNISDYIAQVVQETLNSKGIVSPLAQNTTKTNIISPLADDSSVSVSLKDSEFSIHSDKNASSAAVAIIDNQGNARFQGDLSSHDASIAGTLQAQNATVSGTLHAGTVIADSIDGLDSKVASATANYLQNHPQTGDYQTSDVSDITSQNIQLSSKEAGKSVYMNIATISAQFATFQTGLLSLGASTFNNLAVMDSLSVGTSLKIGSNSLDVIGEDLQIQPLQQGGISFLSGKVRIDQTGKVEFSQDAHFAKNIQVDGTLMTGIISPIPDQDLVISLGTKKNGQNANIQVKNAQGQTALTINSNGDITSSGSAQFAHDIIASGSAYLAKLNIFSQPAYATSNTTAVATGSAGTAKLKAYQREITIQDPLVTQDSLIYITPVGSTHNQVVSLLRQVPGVSFTVGIEQAIGADIPFNFLIVN